VRITEEKLKEAYFQIEEAEARIIDLEATNKTMATE
jgi:hypothetical protein